MISQNIAYFREKSGFTQTELAEKLGINQSSISKFESGVIVPTGPLVGELARALGATAGQIIGTEPIAD